MRACRRTEAAVLQRVLRELTLFGGDRTGSRLACDVHSLQITSFALEAVHISMPDRAVQSADSLKVKYEFQYFSSIKFLFLILLHIFMFRIPRPDLSGRDQIASLSCKLERLKFSAESLSKELPGYRALSNAKNVPLASQGRRRRKRRVEECRNGQIGAGEYN